MIVQYFFDGGGPTREGGPAGWGWTCGPRGGGTEMSCGSGSLPGPTTNNEAEYTGLIMAMTHALAHAWAPGDEFMFLGDSKLVVSQVNGDWQVKAANLKPFHERAVHLHQALGYRPIEHVRRAHNARADMLASQGRSNHRAPRTEPQRPPPRAKTFTRR